MTTNTILPCPWCGSRAELDNRKGYRPLVRCADAACNARSPECDSAETAITAWNRVAGRPDLAKMVYEVHCGERMIFTEKENIAIQDRIARAVAEEREACIAAIRARGAKETK